MGIFEKFKIGFKKSASTFTSGLRDIIVKKEIDDKTLNEVEDYLIESDVGVVAASEIKEIISSEKIDPKKDTLNEVNIILKKYIIKLMKPLEKIDFFNKNESLKILLISGVNGVGKTTTIGKIGKILKSNNNNEHIGGTAVNVGNPHVIFFVKNIDNYNIKKIGPSVENNKLFPEKCNVTIAKVINDNLIKVKVWERGAGQTKACGTAACATAVAGNINNYIKEKVDVEFELGRLSIYIDEKKNIHMKGPVSKIKEIDIKL